jgi:hypothetical protein
MTNKQNKESGRKWDGRSRVSNDVYRKRYVRILRYAFNKFIRGYVIRGIKWILNKFI